MSQRLDTLSDKKLKFKPKAVPRKATAKGLSAPSVNKIALNQQKRKTQQQQRTKKTDNKNGGGAGGVIISQGPLADGAISMGGSVRMATRTISNPLLDKLRSKNVKNEFESKDNISSNEYGNGSNELMVDINQPWDDAEGELFPNRAKRNNYQENSAEKITSTSSVTASSNESSRDSTPFIIEENGVDEYQFHEENQLKSDFKEIEILLSECCLNKDADGDVKIENQSEIDASDEKLQQNSNSNKNKLMFIQLPCALPDFTSGEEVKEDEITIKDEKNANDDAGGAGKAEGEGNGANKNKNTSSDKDKELSNMNISGEIGELRIHESGKITMKLGNIIFDVSKGGDASFVQNLVALDTENNVCWQLGDVQQRLVATPNL